MSTITDSDLNVYTVQQVPLTGAQIEASVQKGHDIGSSASEIDAVVGGTFSTNLDITTASLSTNYGLDLHHSAGQGTATDIIGLVVHNYTDSPSFQLDNVGDNDILILKNASNPTLRPDKGAEYVGTGDFIRLISAEYNEGVQTGPTIFQWDADGVLNFTKQEFPATFNQVKAVGDQSVFAYEFLQTNEHIKSFNFANILQILKDGGSHVMNFVGTTIFRHDNVDVMRLSKYNAIFHKSIELTSTAGIKDKNGSQGTAGQVLTALGTGLCEWQTPV